MESLFVYFTYLVFNVLTLFFVGSVIHGLEDRFANTFRMVVANLVWNSVGYWVAYFFRDVVAFRFVISSIFGYWIGFAYSFGDIFTSCGVGGVIYGMALSNRFRMD